MNRLHEVVSSLEQRLQVFGNIAPSKHLAKSCLHELMENHYDSNDPFIDDTEAELVSEFVIEQSDLSCYRRVEGGLEGLMKDKEFLRRWNKR